MFKRCDCGSCRHANDREFFALVSELDDIPWPEPNPDEEPTAAYRSPFEIEYAPCKWCGSPVEVSAEAVETHQRFCQYRQQHQH